VGHKRRQTLRLTKSIREIARAHGVPAGGWVSNGMGMTYLAESFDVIGEMTYTSHPRAMRGPLSLVGETELICLVWEQHVEADALEQEIREAVHAGCSTVGVWTGTVARDYKARPRRRTPSAARLAPSRRVVALLSENILTGDGRFVVTEGTVGTKRSSSVSPTQAR